jgi:predicted transcriptional regulator
MALTVRLSQEEQEALATYADRSGVSQNEVMRAALRDFVQRQSHSELLEQVMDSELPPFAEALERLGQ